MRVYPEFTVDGEFAKLGTDGFSGSLNDRQFAFLRSRGLTNSLTDMFAEYSKGFPPESEKLVLYIGEETYGAETTAYFHYALIDDPMAEVGNTTNWTSSNYDQPPLFGLYFALGAGQVPTQVVFDGVVTDADGLADPSAFGRAVLQQMRGGAAIWTGTPSPEFQLESGTAAIALTLSAAGADWQAGDLLVILFQANPFDTEFFLEGFYRIEYANLIEVTLA